MIGALLPRSDSWHLTGVRSRRVGLQNAYGTMKSNTLEDSVARRSWYRQKGTGDDEGNAFRR